LKELIKHIKGFSVELKQERSQAFQDLKVTVDITVLLLNNMAGSLMVNTFILRRLVNSKLNFIDLLKGK